jgi:hypothetical protein
LNRYVAAYIALDEAELKSIDPGFSGIRNRMLIKSLELRVSNVSIEVSPDGEAATLRATQTFAVVFNRPLTGPPPTGVLSWRLRKIGGAWRVLP